MGVGGLKGHSTQNGSGSGRAGRPYGWMLLLFIAFGALFVGVMALHKHKQKRVFDLVIRDKNLQLHSIHLQLQKERDFGKDAKQKFEELKSELYTLRNQKSDLSGKIREMQSTISSLKEEHKAIESALGEKQNEINLMKKREKYVNEQNNQGSFLAKVLSLKEAEFENLKGNLELPVRDGNINFRYPNSPMKFTNKVSTARRDETVNTNKQNGGQLHNYLKTADGENSTNGEDTRKTENVAVSRKISGEPHILQSSQQDFQLNNTTDENPGKEMSYKTSKSNKGLDMDTQKSNTNGTEARTNSVVEFKNPKDDAEGTTFAANTKFEANSVADFENPKDVDDTILTANTKFGNNGQEKNIVRSARGKGFFRNEEKGRQKERPGESELLKLFKEKGQSLGIDIRIASEENVPKFKSFNPVLWKEGKESKGDTKVGSGSKTKTEHSSSVLKSKMNSETRISERFSQASDKVQVNKNINNKRSRVISDDKKKKITGIFHQEAQANSNPHRTEKSGNDKAANPKKRYISDKNADIADLEVNDTYEGRIRSSK